MRTNPSTGASFATVPSMKGGVSEASPPPGVSPSIRGEGGFGVSVTPAIAGICGPPRIREEPSEKYRVRAVNPSGQTRIAALQLGFARRKFERFSAAACASRFDCLRQQTTAELSTTRSNAPAADSPAR